MKKAKPIVEKARIFDGITGLEDTFSDMFEVKCGLCKETFGLSTGSPKDTSYFETHYLFCNKCGTPVDWSEKEEK